MNKLTRDQWIGVVVALIVATTLFGAFWADSLFIGNDMMLFHTQMKTQD